MSEAGLRRRSPGTKPGQLVLYYMTCACFGAGTAASSGPDNAPFGRGAGSRPAHTSGDELNTLNAIAGNDLLVRESHSCMHGAAACDAALAPDAHARVHGAVDCDAALAHDAHARLHDASNRNAALAHDAHAASEVAPRS